MSLSTSPSPTVVPAQSTFAEIDEALLDTPELLASSQIVIETEVQDCTTAQQRSSWTGLKVFGSTFVTIFCAELGDKTQLTTLLMSAESHAPWTVFAGAATALIATSFVGVLLGQWLSRRVSPKTLGTSAGVLLLLISVLLFWDVMQPTP